MKQWVSEHPWAWPLAGSMLLWVIASVLAGHVSVGLLLANATLASFLALVGLGQMVVIASGGGSIDLSLPYTLTLSAFVAAGIMNGTNSHMVTALLVALLAGLVVGLLNGVLIAMLRIPPIITTLAVGYVVDTAILKMSAVGIGQQGLSPAFVNAFHAQVDGASPVILVALVAGGVLMFLLNRSVYGRYLLAMGQSRRAAPLAGVPVNRLIMVNYLISALLGACAGILLGAFDSGAFINMGTSYLLISIGAVVIGGSLISGGKATVTGTLSGALLLSLLVTVLELSHLGIGFQDVVEGSVVVAIIVISQGSRAPF